MACGSCGTKEGKSAGCQSNGDCSTGGCNRKNTFDWLTNMSIPTVQPFALIEVKFKGGKTGFYYNPKNIELFAGDIVVVKTDKGQHVGRIGLQGELVRLQMAKKKIKITKDLLSIERKAGKLDIEKWKQAQQREMPTIYRAREIIKEVKLKMKLSDVEYQADNTKATFYYSADTRIDFRELIKLLATEFRIRVEMRQINMRQEAGRLGGLGSCGRELCCSTWLSSFKHVSTSAARYQNLSINTSKLSGQCGRLKCCLNYELETYVEALKDIPKIKKALITDKGKAFLQKTDIFKKLLWFSYQGENTWFPLTVEQVKMILELNREGKNIPSLNPKEWEGYQSDEIEFKKAEPLEIPKLVKNQGTKGKESSIKKTNPKTELSKAKNKLPNRDKKPRNANGFKPKK